MTVEYIWYNCTGTCEEVVSGNNTGLSNGTNAVIKTLGSGNTTKGEISVLAGLGISESAMGVPIDTTSEVVEIGRLDIGVPILMASCAATANHIVVINRVKPHTKFRGSIESGLTICSP